MKNINIIKEILFTALHQSNLDNEDKIEVANDLLDYFARKERKELSIKRGDLVNGKIVDEVVYNEKLKCYHIFFNFSEFIGIEDVRTYTSSEDLEKMNTETDDKVIKFQNFRRY